MRRLRWWLVRRLLGLDGSEFRCVDCGVDTHNLDGDHSEEWYHVHDSVWPIGPDDGLLCLGCLEQRLGRRLNAADFSDAPINRDCRSQRMRDRLACPQAHA